MFSPNHPSTNSVPSKPSNARAQSLLSGTPPLMTAAIKQCLMGRLRPSMVTCHHDEGWRPGVHAGQSVLMTAAMLCMLQHLACMLTCADMLPGLITHMPCFTPAAKKGWDTGVATAAAFMYMCATCSPCCDRSHNAHSNPYMYLASHHACCCTHACWQSSHAIDVPKKRLHKPGGPQPPRPRASDRSHSPVGLLGPRPGLLGQLFGLADGTQVLGVGALIKAAAPWSGLPEL